MRRSSGVESAAPNELADVGYEWTVFATALGWIGAAGRDEHLARVTLGHSSPHEAARGLGLSLETGRESRWLTKIAKRFAAYAEGRMDDFRDIKLEPRSLTPLAQRIENCCRRIPYGETRSYGEIARAVGRPRAARAVGNVMAHNVVGLVVPCHRVLASGGKMGGFSCRTGATMKRQLLELEARVIEGGQRTGRRRTRAVQ
jgi:methylated-DNA-[protein]-cysteine S-methyltransferase